MNELYVLVSVLLGYVVGDKLSAICEMDPTTGMEDYPLEGTITFTQMPGQNVTIDIALEGFNSTDMYTKHGFHVHENSLMGDKCKASGGHFNPANVDHAGPDDAIRHVGDLGNIIEGPDGSITHSFTDHIIQLEGNYSIIGRAIVIHEREDDLGLGGEDDSKTTGHAGARLGCCLIEGTTSTDVTSGMESGMTSSGATMSGDSGSGATTMGSGMVNDDNNHGALASCVNLSLLLMCGLLVVSFQN